MSTWRTEQAACFFSPLDSHLFTDGPPDVVCCFTGIQTIDSTQALFLPIGASVSLLVMFFFFDSVQVVFTICTAGKSPVIRLSSGFPFGSYTPGGASYLHCQVKNIRRELSWSHRRALLFSTVLATIAFAFLLLPMCQYLTRPCSPQNKWVCVFKWCLHCYLFMIIAESESKLNLQGLILLGVNEECGSMVWSVHCFVFGAERSVLTEFSSVVIIG